ncbi:MAG: GNAT family N-acetyltransferase [Chloroflexi bacterium]|nr:GNAT family N-acetyltransferase [Chloroflexota bacterium]
MMEIYELLEISDETVTAFERLFPQLTNLPAPTREELEQMITSESCRIFMARVNGEIAGAAALGCYRTPSGLHAWIEDVVVDEAYRRQGVGESLTRTLIETARSMGAHSLSLTSRPAREAANRLYQQLGFMKWETNLYRYPL